MRLFTAQYKYAGEDRLDITAKGKDPIGKVFAPTWKMVMESKAGKITWDEYSRMYHDLMRESYAVNRKTWDEVLTREEVTLVCFCQEGDHCHRYLLSGYFEKLGVNYEGERKLYDICYLKPSVFYQIF